MKPIQHPPVGFTRRGVLTTSAAALPLVMPRVGRAAPRDGDDVLRIGLIGCGGRGTGAAFQALNAEAGTVVLTHMADAFQDRIDSSLVNLKNALGEEMADRVQVTEEGMFTGFGGFQQLIDSDVDVVLLATPPHFRPAHLEAAVAAGKHIFTEKPMAVDAPGVRRVLEVARRAKEQNTALVSGFCWRYHNKYRALFERVRGGILGDLSAVYATYNSSPVRYREYEEPWSEMEWHIRNWQAIDWLSGDHVVEQAIHSIDKINWVMGDVAPLEVTAVGGRQAREGDASGNIYDHFSATFNYAGGANAYLMCRQMYGCSNDNSDFLWGSRGRATIHPWAGVFDVEGEEPWTAEEVPGNDMYQQEHDELFASIRAGEPINNGEWMCQSTLMAIMVRMAAYTGQTITYDQALNSTEVLGPTEYAWGDDPLNEPAIPGKKKFL